MTGTPGSARTQLEACSVIASSLEADAVARKPCEGRRMSWTDERIDRLKELWSQGKTASFIADELGGVSRNAVIGKAHRLGLQSRPSPVKPNEPAPKAKAKVREKAEAAAPAPKPAPAPAPA